MLSTSPTQPADSVRAPPRTGLQSSAASGLLQSLSATVTPEAPNLKNLRLRDRSLTSRGSRKRPASVSDQGNPPFCHEVFMRTRPKPTHYIPDLHADRVHHGTHPAYDFDPTVVALSSRTSPAPVDSPAPVNTLSLQPKTRRITEEQLINEVHGIYAGLVLVEKKCVEIDQQQVKNKGNLNTEQWQALIGLHRALLHEHHDFFLASQHPSASPALQRLASKYAMPARMWTHGIHSFLKFLRHRLPASLDYMLAFIYTAYSMMTLLLESVPSFENTWIECLGDLGRYRMALEEVNLQDREHHLAVLSRPNFLQQLFFYTKSLVCIQSFPNTRESILLLFKPLLAQESISDYPPAMLYFVKAHGHCFCRLSVLSFLSCGHEFMSLLGTHIGRVGAKWREQGVYVASANISAMLEYGSESSPIFAFFARAAEFNEPQARRIEAAKTHYSQLSSDTKIPSCLSLSDPSAVFTEALSYASCFAFHVLSFILKHIGDKNILPHVHSEVPWQALATFLNTLNWQGVNELRLKNDNFPVSESGESGGYRHLPEDFLMRGQLWTQQGNSRYSEPWKSVHKRRPCTGVGKMAGEDICNSPAIRDKVRSFALQQKDRIVFQELEFQPRVKSEGFWAPERTTAV
ncbi:uncharacterized protein BDCG_02202 [Blastomyces dermatitidis ER-3]|uniref:DNA/RNA-binding domain-containing protein n=1 Tax=Ajellomyces dermatitidis (strain ER-3 / ATCC MYA-2586) TaxID=559297 RepID=A0ABP2EY33_AJEDR|nr:uncharacterized protein BDCG_02202 [Blastomyces dermatitidis ER-3]EEQ87082.2 hypothetical protein BDCG_02202 [Blastomyces dermatitidis ER-3]